MFKLSGITRVFTRGVEGGGAKVAAKAVGEGAARSHRLLTSLGAVGALAGAGLLLASCAAGTASGNDTPEQTAHRMLSNYNSAWGNQSQLDVNWEHRRTQEHLFDDGKSVYSIQHLLKDADNHVKGDPPDMTRSEQGNGKASYDEIVQIARSFDQDSSGKLESPEASAFNREYAEQYDWWRSG